VAGSVENFNLDTAIVIAIIAAIATIIAPAISYFLTKHFEREAEWRAHKLEHYKAFMLALNAIVGPNPPTDDRVRFANAANNIFLVGSTEVLVALRDFLDVTADGKSDLDRHDELLTKLIVAIRHDTGIKGAAVPEGYEFRLWSGKPK